MQLSPEQESELIERNMKKIYRAVDNFTARCAHQLIKIDFDDLVQEVTIVFLNHIRRCETPEEIDVFPWFDAKQAMSRLWLSSQPLSCPKRTGSIKSIVRSMPQTVSYETNPASVISVDGMSKNWVDDKDTVMDLELFVDTLPGYVDRIVDMKLWGLSSRQIAGQLGISEQAVGQKLKNYYQKYKKFTEEEDSDE